jgi:protein-arginine kinase activator protein McsA
MKQEATLIAYGVGGSLPFKTNMMRNVNVNKSQNKQSCQASASGRLSSYQKMKLKYEKQIRELTNDIIALVDEKDFEKTNIVKMQWEMRLDVEKAIWYGSPTYH